MVHRNLSQFYSRELSITGAVNIREWLLTCVHKPVIQVTEYGRRFSFTKATKKPFLIKMSNDCFWMFYTAVIPRPDFFYCSIQWYLIPIIGIKVAIGAVSHPAPAKIPTGTRNNPEPQILASTRHYHHPTNYSPSFTGTILTHLQNTGRSKSRQLSLFYPTDHTLTASAIIDIVNVFVHRVAHKGNISCGFQMCIKNQKCSNIIMHET